MDNIFRAYLVLYASKQQHLLSTSECIFSSYEIGTVEEGFPFSISWTRESHLDLENLLAPAPNCYEVLGTLQATIPYGLVKGGMHFTEVVPFFSNLVSAL